MSQLVLSRGVVSKNWLKRFLPQIQMGPYFLLFSLVVFVALITIITLMFSARQVTKGYVLNALEAKHQELLRVNERKDMEISTVRSLNYIEKSSKVRSMRNPSRVSYFHAESTIAKN
ncbi:hypothetical protein HY604_03885 [Candidatus Peregrinibacteria bacterium]|nr:hypothetical protein [Candidatus Peregrinibacteria bacterium]